MNPQQVRDRVRHWVDVMVVGENLCPFAARPLQEGRVRIAVCEASDWDDIFRCALDELDRLLRNPPEQLETTLVAVPQGLQDFADYLDMLAALEDALQALDLEGVVQVASFHPDYLFADAAEDDPANHTNRSPYPLFHWIREASLSDALASVSHPERIPARNQARMRELGLAGIRARLKTDVE